MQLISFLGRVPKNESAYRTTVYEFSDGSKTDPISFLGLSLIKRIKPEKLVILGTAGSMWDHLLQTASYTPNEELHLELIEQVERKKVTQELLNKFKDMFHLYHGIPVELVIIPYGQSMDEQIQIMEIIAQHVPDKTEVTLDVTHGFRHLPMLGLIAAQYLERLKKVTIQSIYYGMFDPDLGVGSVYDLKGLLQLNAWVFALSQFDKDGDYSVFSEPLKNDGFTDAGIKSLERAAYYERVFNVSMAKQQLSTFKQALGDSLPGAGKLFTQALTQRFSWSHSQELKQHQRKLAHFYLDNGDYVRSAIFGVEAFISSLIKENEREYEYYDRAKAEDEFRDSRRGNIHLKNNYEDLKKIRNALAHGTEAKNAHERTILQDPEKLKNHLKQLLKSLGI